MSPYGDPTHERPRLTGSAGNLAAVQAANNLVLAIDDPDRYGEAYLRRQAATFFPFTSAVAQVERAGIPGLVDGDPTLRETRIGRADDPDWRFVQELINSVRARTPGWSESLPPRRNLWGAPIVLGGGLGPDLISPIYTSSGADPEPVDLEILRLGVRLTMPARTIGGVELSAAEYDRYVELAGDAAKDPSTGLGALGTLNAIVSGDHPLSYEYARASEGENGGKARVIRKLLLAFREFARGELSDEFPELRALMHERRVNEQRALVGN